MKTPKPKYGWSKEAQKSSVKQEIDNIASLWGEMIDRMVREIKAAKPSKIQIKSRNIVKLKHTPNPDAVPESHLAYYVTESDDVQDPPSSRLLHKGFSDEAMGDSMIMWSGPEVPEWIDRSRQQGIYPSETVTLPSVLIVERAISQGVMVAKIDDEPVE